MRRTFLALFVVLLPGCGTLFFHNPQSIRVTSNVPGSLVIAKDEGILGKTDGLSGEFQLDRSHDHRVLVSAHGNEAATIDVQSHFSWWRILISLGGDIPLGVIPFPPVVWGVVGIVTDVASGSWRVLDDDVAVALRPRAELEPLPDESPGPPTTSPGPPSTERAASDPPPGHACASCNSPVEPGAHYCPRCGAKLVDGAAVRPCPICGEPRAVGTQICPHCGLK